MSHFHKVFLLCLKNAKCFGAFASLNDTRFRGLFRVLQPYLAYVCSMSESLDPNGWGLDQTNEHHHLGPQTNNI